MSSTKAVTGLLEGLLDLPGLEELEDVALLHVGEAVQHDAALLALVDLGDVVLEAAQRADLAGPDDGAVADQAHAGAAGDLAVGDLAAGDRSDSGGLERLLDLG